MSKNPVPRRSMKCIVAPTDLALIERGVEVIEREANLIRASHTYGKLKGNGVEPDDWAGDDDAKADYDELMAIAVDLRALAKRETGK